MRSLHMAGCVVALALSCSAARAALVIDFMQLGNDVVAVGAGTANVSGLSLFDQFPSAQINLDAATGNFRGGSTSGGFSRWRVLLGPNTGYGSFGIGFGPGTSDSNFPSSSSGDYFGLTAFNNMLFLPSGYVSGTLLSNTTTWNNRTFANLGLAPVGSSFVYRWGSGANADSLTINISAIPEPSTFAMLLAGLCVAGMRRSSALRAAARTLAGRS